MKLEKILLLILLCLLLGLMAYYWRLGKSIPASTKATAAVSHTRATVLRAAGIEPFDVAMSLHTAPSWRRT